VLLVALSWVDMFMAAFSIGGESMSIAKLLRIVRMTKVLRLLRVVTKLRELRIMAMMIVHSLQSLFWLFWLLLLMLYVAATILTQGATEYLFYYDEGTIELDEVMQGFYGSLWRTMYTLFLAMSGGISWGEVAAPWLLTNWVFFVLFMLFIFFALFSVLNIVTGVFVDSAIQAAQRDRSVMVEKQRAEAVSTKAYLLVLLEEIDTDGTGYITKEELDEAMLHDHIKAYFEAMSIDTDSLDLLVNMLDDNGDGNIDIEEFIEGLQRLKGEAKSFDIHMMMMQNRSVLKTVQDYLDAHHGTDGKSGHRGTQS
jgi:hypothetical protein